MKELYLDGALFSGTEEEFLAVKEFFCKSWWLNCKIHREGGPAIIWKDGLQGWHQDGLWHRIDGPAIISSDGRGDWYFKGVDFSRFLGRFFPVESFTRY